MNILVQKNTWRQYYFEMDDDMLIYANTPKDMEDERWQGVIHLTISNIVRDPPSQASATEFTLNNGMIDVRLRAATAAEKEAWVREISKR